MNTKILDIKNMSIKNNRECNIKKNKEYITLISNYRKKLSGVFTNFKSERNINYCIEVNIVAQPYCRYVINMQSEKKHLKIVDGRREKNNYTIDLIGNGKKIDCGIIFRDCGNHKIIVKKFTVYKVNSAIKGDTIINSAKHLTKQLINTSEDKTTVLLNLSKEYESLSKEMYGNINLSNIIGLYIGNNCIETYISYINNNLHKTPNSKFFVLSDLKEDIQKLINIYGDKIIYNTKNNVVNIIALLKCKYIYCSNNLLLNNLIKQFKSNKEYIILERDVLNSNSYNLHNSVIQSGYSLITASRNRTDELIESLTNWIKYKFNEFVIVDFSSNKKISEDPTIKLLMQKDNRIKVYRIENEKRWHHSKAWNLAIQLSQYSDIYKLDCESKINCDILNRYKLTDGIYYCGNWRICKIPNDYQSVGTLFIKRELLLKVNLYNENIIFYGWEDSDLYLRLNTLFIRKDVIPNDYIYIINDSDNKKKDSNSLSKLTSSQSIQFNKILSSTVYPQWNLKYKLSQYKLKDSTIALINSYYIDNSFISKTTYDNILRSTKRK
jgi:hypothetical protein